MRVMVNVGDTIAHDQPVLELETDKATIEVPSSVAGVVKDIRVKSGDKVKVGAVVLTVDENGGAAAEKPKAEGKAEAKPENADTKAQPEQPEEPAAQASDTTAGGDSRTAPASESRATSAPEKPADHKILSMPTRV